MKILILAAGKGKRMRSNLPKALMPLKGKPMIKHLLESIEKSGLPNPTIVIGHGKELVKKELGKKYTYAVQEEQFGTGHAVKSAKSAIDSGHEIIIVISADQPFISEQTIKNIISMHNKKKPAITIGTVIVPDFKEWRKGLNYFGRIIRGDGGSVEKIVEFKDTNEREKKIKELNLALYAFDSEWLWKNIDKIKNENAQGEYYLTDLIKIARDQNKKIEAVPVINTIEGLHPNTKEELEILEKFAV